MSDDDLRDRLESIMARAGVESSEASSPRTTWDLGSREPSEAEALEASDDRFGEVPVRSNDSPYRTNLSSRPLPIARMDEEKPTNGPRPPAVDNPNASDVRRTQPVPRLELEQSSNSNQEGNRMPGISVAGRAGEGRGSGFIFLPTPEIREALAEGPYRLRVGGKEYGPVDEAGLVELIKHGALLGGEEIATLDGPWVRVVHHPAFTQLRTKMARGIHEVLREMSVQGRSVKEQNHPRVRQQTSTSFPPVRPTDEAHSGFILLPTEEIQSSIGEGRYRLRIDGKIHGPVEASDIVLLIKHGALLGADEIATLDGPWMPVTMHPAFKELRSRMAAGAHGVLRELGAEARTEPAKPKKPVKPKKSVEKKPVKPKKSVEKKPVKSKEPVKPKKSVAKKPVAKKPGVPTNPVEAQPVLATTDAPSGRWGRFIVLCVLTGVFMGFISYWLFT